MDVSPSSFVYLCCHIILLFDDEERHERKTANITGSNVTSRRRQSSRKEKESLLFHLRRCLVQYIVQYRTMSADLEIASSTYFCYSWRLKVK